MQKDIGHLLVVDDNELNREMLSRRLTRAGFKVSVSVDGPEALELISKQNYDLILLDIMMPGMTGLEVLEIIRKRFSAAELPVIMATAKTQSEDVVEALKMGANDYITKPIDFDVLLARIKTHTNLKQLFKLKDEFLGIASHDLKNPLFVIICQAYLINTKAPVGSVMTSEVHDMVNSIAHHARTMQSIIGDFLDFQAVEDGHIKIKATPSSLSETCSRVINNLKPYAAEKQITFSFECPPNVPLVAFDVPRIEQVLQNMLGNAVKFNQADSSVHVVVQDSESCVRVEVRDNGQGLTDDDMEKVFVKYETLSAKPTGNEKSSGLGLAICKKLIDLHDGEIGVYNQEEGGAAFWFTLPKEPAKKEQAARS